MAPPCPRSRPSVRHSVRLSVCPSFRPSVRPSPSVHVRVARRPPCTAVRCLHTRKVHATAWTSVTQCPNLSSVLVRVYTLGSTVLTVLFKDTGRGRTRTSRHTQNADRGRATPHPGTNPHTGQNGGKDTPGPDQGQNGRDHKARKQRNPGARQTAGRTTNNLHHDPQAPRAGQLSQKDRGPCRQRDLRHGVWHRSGPKWAVSEPK